MPPAVEGEDVEGHGLLEGRDEDHAAEDRQRLPADVVVGLADRVEDDVRALAAGQRADAGRHILALRVDDLGCDLRRTGETLVAAHHADDPRAPPGGDLGGCLADLAVEAEDQHRLARLRHSTPAEAFLRGHEGHADPRRLVERNAGRLLDERLGLDDEMGRMRAVAADAEIAGGAEDGAAQPFGRPVDDGPGEIAAGRPREDRVGHHADRRLRIRRVDGRGAHLDQHVRGGEPLDAAAFDGGSELLDGLGLGGEAQRLRHGHAGRLGVNDGSVHRAGSMLMRPEPRDRRRAP